MKVMNPERRQQINQLLDAALELEPDQRAAFLDESCAGNDALRREVESLIAAHQQAESFIEIPPVEAVEDLPACESGRSIIGHSIGPYIVISELGRGGMGEVYLGHDTRLGRRVALKLLPADLSKGRDHVDRFEREVRAASALNHPNILTVYDIGQIDDMHFIATEFIEGETLWHRLASAKMTLSEVLEVAVQIAGALAAAHQVGIAHRDIKPENIMLRPDGYVKVLDFGIAKLIEHKGLATQTEAPTMGKAVTDSGMLLGTVNYMSPEQARGISIDERTDIFSLGVVLYEMLACRRPFEGESKAEVLVAILDREPPPLARFVPEAPGEFQRIVSKALRKDRKERYQTVQDLLLDLKNLRKELEFEARLIESGSHKKPVRRSFATASMTEADTAVQMARASDELLPVRGESRVARLFSVIRQRKRSLALALMTLLLAVAGLSYFFYGGEGGRAQMKSVAVLPFVNTSNDTNMEYLSDGITESLISSLSRLSQLKVIARNSAYKFKGKEFDLQKVARELGVQVIVTGTIAARGDNLKISVELVDANDNTQMWGEQYNRKPADLQAVQEEIAYNISEKLRLRLTDEQAQQLAKRATKNPEAYQLYVNGVYYTRKGGTENQAKALDYFNQAIAVDRDFALAYANIAIVRTILATNNVVDPKEAIAEAKAAAQKALELDKTLAEAHAALAVIINDEWDWSGAEIEHKQAIEYNPNLAPARANYAGYLSRMGRYTEALIEIKRARELDPLRINFRSNEGRILLWSRQYDKAIEQFQNIINLQPDFSPAHENLAYAYDAKGMYAEAIAEYNKVISLDRETTGLQAYLGYAFAMSGKRDEALAYLNKLKTTNEYVSPAELAILYAGLGDKEEALDALERAYAAHDLQLQYLKVEPHYDSLRSDPRFIDLLRRVGLAP